MGRIGHERGAVAVEFALLLPILIALLLGILEFGMAYSAQVTVTNAAREGVRTMAIQNSPASATTAVEAAASSLSPAVQDSDVVVTVTNGTAACTAGATATVTVNYPFKFMTGFFGSGLAMTGKATMRCGG